MSERGGWTKYLPFENNKLNYAAFFFCAAISANNAYNYLNPEVVADSITDAYFRNSDVKKKEFEELEKYVLEHVSAADFAGVRRNFKPTTNIMEASNDRAYHEGAVREYACPVEIRKVRIATF